MFASLFSLAGLAKLALNAILPLANSIVGYLDRKGDREVEQYKAKAGAVTNLGGEALRVQAAREAAQASITMQAMTHPIWWVAWCGFVLPPMLYDAAIYFVSTFDTWLNTPGCHIWKINEAVPKGIKLCEYYVRKVPADQAAARGSIIYFIFGAQAAAGVAGGLVDIATKWLAQKK
jgi:hypothetical protein